MVMIPSNNDNSVAGNAEINPIVAKLKDLSRGAWKQRTVWQRPKTPPPLGLEGLGRLGLIRDNFTWHVTLKTEINNLLLNQNTDLYSLYFWIVNSWGGIGRFKNTSINCDRISNFLNEVDSGYLSEDSFSVISSLSKIASFKNPHRDVIYDARAVTTLDWLLFRYGSGDRQYYPIPAGRHKVLSRFDIGTLLRFSHITDARIRGEDEPLFNPPSEAYHKYCAQIRQLTPLVFEGEEARQPYYLEMLLFAVADTEVFEDMKQSVRVTVGVTEHR